MTGAHHTFQLRSALKLGLKAFGATRSQLERITAQLSLPPGADPSGADGEAFDIEELPLERLTPTQRSALPLVLRLIGKPRLLALHPGGLVLADPAIEAYMPVENAPRGLSVAQYDADSIERIGLVKIDLLGSRFLTQLAETVELVKGRHVELESGREEVLRDRREIDLDDPSTLARLDRADTIGCFQVETPAVRALLERLRIGSVEDCVAALALVRPGAAAGATKRDYVLRARGDRRLEARHPLIASRLRNTLGLLIYDEDLMTLLSATAGISLGAADEIRSQIIDAGRDHERLSELERRFLRLARRAGSDSDLATTVWKEVLRFAAYSFSKAHAWSYALMAYQSAYLKTHHPVEFACALLNSYGGAYPLRTIAADLQRSGVPLLGPTVNASAIRATVVPNGSAVDGAVRVGLSRVKHLTRKSAGMILASRQDRGPFRDFGDLLERIRLSRREIEALVLCGACDDLPPLSGAGYPFLHEAALKGLRGELSPAAFERIAAAGVEADAAGDATAGERLATYRSLVRIRNELRFLDLHLSDHPMHVLRAAARAQGCLSSSEIRAGWSAHDADRVRFAGIIAASRPHTLGKREAMQYVTFEDEEGLLEAVIPPPLYRRLAGQLTTPGPYLVEGRPSEDLGHLQLIVCALSPFHERERAGPTDARRGEAANG
jgi:DNA polymerase-3 subunit alpha/error-prone DNA polymerase